MTDTTAPTGDFRIGAVVGAGFSIFGQQWLHFLGLGLIVLAPALVAQLLLGTDPTAAGGEGTAGDGVVAIISLLLAFVLTAAVTISSFEALRGRPQSIGAALQRGLARFLPVLGLGLLITLIVVVLVAIGGGIIFALASALGSVALSVIAGVVVFCAVVWLYLRYAVAIPALVVERTGVIASLSRSVGLTSGNRWKILGVFLLIGIIFIAASMLAPLIVIGALSFGGLAAGIVVIIGVVVAFLVQVVSTVLFAIFACVAYYHLRRAKEGVGIEEIASVFD